MTRRDAGFSNWRIMLLVLASGLTVLHPGAQAEATSSERSEPLQQLAGDSRPKAVPYYTPRRKSATRSAIMDAARAPISRKLGQPVIFLVDVLRTDNVWAYLQAVPLQPDGTAMKWSATPFAEAWKDDMMSDIVMILLRKGAGGWTVVDNVVGPTDVFWYGWIDAYGLPEALFR